MSPHRARPTASHAALLAIGGAAMVAGAWLSSTAGPVVGAILAGIGAALIAAGWCADLGAT